MDKAAIIGIVGQIATIVIAAWVALRGNTRDDAMRAERLATVLQQISEVSPKIGQMNEGLARHDERIGNIEEMYNGVLLELRRRSEDWWKIDSRLAVIESQIQSLRAMKKIQ